MKKTRIFLLVFIAMLLLPSLHSFGQAHSFTTSSLTYYQNFDGMGATGTTYPTGWIAKRYAGTGTIGQVLTLGVTDGAATAGNVYNVGTTSATDRALGTLASGTTTPVFGARFVNNTGTTITQVNLNAMMEQWRSGSSSTVNEVIAFEYSFTATAIDTGTYTALTSMNLNEILTSTTSAAAVNGNLPANRAPISGVLTGISWANGTSMWIRWIDTDNSGSDGLYAIDSLTVTVTISSSNNPTKLAITSINAGVSPTVNLPFAVTVQAQDANGLPANVIANTIVTLSKNSGNGTLSGTLTDTILAGTHTKIFSNVIYNQADTGVKITATRIAGDNLTSATSTGFSVLGVATKLKFVNFPTTGQTTSPLATFSVEARRDDNTLDPTYTGTITLSLNTGSGTLSGTLSKPAVAGVAVFNDIQLSAAGSYTLIAASTGLASDTSTSVTISPGPAFTADIMPLYIQGLNGTNNNRIPYVYRATVSNLTPNATYRFFNQADTVINSTLSGAGSAIFVKSTGNFVRAATLSLSTAGQYSEFTTNSSGSFTGWFITEPTANDRFTPGKTLYMRIMLNNGSGGTTVVNRLTCTTPVYVKNFGTGTSDITGIYSHSQANPKDFIFLYDNISGTGRPISGAVVEKDGAAAQTTYATFYQNQVDTFNGGWGTILPNTLSNGVQRIEVRSLASGNVVGCAVDADGVWTTGNVNTVNPSSGTTPLVIATADAPLTNCGPTKLAITSINSGYNPTVSLPFTVTVQAQDANGNPVNVLQKTKVTLTKTTGTGQLSGNTSAYLMPGTNQIIITGLIYNVAESGVSLTATDSAGVLTQAVSSLFTVSSVIPKPSKLKITSVNNGQPIFKDKPFNVNFNTQTSSGQTAGVFYQTIVHLNIISGTGILWGTLVDTLAPGVSTSTFTGLSYSVAESGLKLVLARLSGDTLNSDTSAIFTVHPIATKLKFVNVPTSAFTNTNLTAFTVEARLPSNVADTNYTDSISIAKFGGSGNLIGTLKKPAIKGIATFSDIKFSSSDNYKLIATSGTLTQDTSATILVNDPPINTNLSPGDIAFLAYQYDNPDKFAFVTLVDIGGGTQIKFTDNAWTGTTFLMTEQTGIYTAPATGLPKGSVVIIDGTTVTGGGTMSLALNGLSSSGDQIIAYQGTTNPTFVAGISSSNWITSGTPTSNQSYLPSTLSLGTHAVGFLSEKDNGYYSGTLTSGTQAQLLTAINDSTNWTRSDNMQTWPTFTFTVANPIDSIPPHVVNAFATAANQVNVVFNEKVDTTAENIHNYQGLPQVISAVRNNLKDTITLTLSTPLQVGVFDTLYVVNVKDLAGNILTQNQPFPILWLPTISIDSARHLTVGTQVAVEGIVTNGAELGSLRFLQDATAGIAVNPGTGSPTFAPQRGDKILLKGTLTNIANFMVINPVQVFQVISSGNALPATQLITIPNLNETVESELIRINNVKFTTTGTFSANSTYQIVSGTDTGTVLIQGTNTNLIGKQIPLVKVNLSGICVQNSVSNPNTGYQLLLRDKNDLIFPAGSDTIPPAALLAWATDSVTVKVKFSEKTDTSATNTYHYQGLGSILSITQSVSADSVTLKLQTPLVSGAVNSLTISGIRDTIGNTITVPQVLQFTWVSGASTQLTAGDIAFVHYRTDNDDIFGFVALTDIAPLTILNFTDNAWDASGATPTLKTNENTATWTAPATGLSKGSVVSILNPQIGNAVVTGGGTITGKLSGLSTTGDQILCYQGTVSNPQFIAGISSTNWQTSGAVTNFSSYLPSTLTLNYSAVGFTSEVDNGQYNCTLTTGNKAILLLAINNPANWKRNDVPDSISYTGCNFTVVSGAVAPIVSTGTISAITKNSAVCSGDVISDGGASVTARGVCYATTPNPDLSNSHTTESGTTGSFSSTMTGLISNTTYYVRAYATNSAGTSYGNQVSFTTLIDAISENEQISAVIYPNPVHNNFIIQLNRSDKYNLEIHSIDGRLLLQKSFINDQVSINIDNFNIGLYFIVITNSDGQQLKTRIIKQ